jgi:hypothetical protein
MDAPPSRKSVTALRRLVNHDLHIGVTVAYGAANRANSGIESDPPIRPPHACYLAMRIAYPQTLHSKPYTLRARDRDTLAEQVGRGTDCLLMDSNSLLIDALVQRSIR